MIKIIRYSTEGFHSQKQTHHVKGFEYWKDIDLNECPEHLRYFISEARKRKMKFYQEHYNDLQEGLWFFLDGHKNRQSLNHLKQLVPCWEAEIEEDILVYDCNLQQLVTLKDPIVMFGGCYIPKRLIYKIHNVKRRKNKRKEKVGL